MKCTCSDCSGYFLRDNPTQPLPLTGVINALKRIALQAALDEPFGVVPTFLYGIVVLLHEVQLGHGAEITENVCLEFLMTLNQRKVNYDHNRESALKS